MYVSIIVFFVMSYNLNNVMKVWIIYSINEIYGIYFLKCIIKVFFLLLEFLWLKMCWYFVFNVIVDDFIFYLKYEK